uniref:Autophagy-related protein 16, animal type n=1 Tax=Tetraselmis sp. GSL018 TaxID=582737 RepID=A0A061S7D4_9CHLO|eukprot:CAMPEP_0177592794 /NCGR_PEP_ID=MMETSP0419_2-20121207/8759_1 /TAXON_ID=582737 /ORGANISM="Tetraselmis sp., Strain GSL018" /LENGTH=566 /DNA_ID=CAMNT_0019083703 /DNA_START=165 /DNA_END=1865 /DNA_ORIENTATION=-
MKGTVATDVYHRLVDRNNHEVRAFGHIISEYRSLQDTTRLLRVRVGQLEKEACELQAENNTLATTVALAKESETRSEEVQALQAKVRDLNAELAEVYRDKSKLAEDLLRQSQQLEIVRQNNDAQAKELEENKQRITELTKKAKDLAAKLEAEESARAVATEELEKRLAEKEAAKEEAERARSENAQLIDTIVKMKVEQAELLNQAVLEHDEAVRFAETHRAAAKAAQESLTRHASTSGGAGSGLVRSSISHMDDNGNRRSAEAGVVLPARPVVTLPEVHPGGCYSVRFSGSGTAGSDKAVRLWDPESGTSIGHLEGTMGTVLDVEFTCDDLFVLGGGSDKALRLWDTATGRVRHTLTGHLDKVSSVHCSPAAPDRAISGGNDRTIKVWDLHRGYMDKTILCHSSINSVTTTLDGQVIISGHFDGALRFWDLRSAKPINELTGIHSQQITSVLPYNRSNWILTSSKDDTMKVVDIASHEVVRVLRSPGHLASKACLSPDDRYAASGVADAGVCVWDTEKAVAAAHLHNNKGHRPGGQILATDWSPDGRFLASSDRQGTVVVWGGDRV